jgi:hypothetical protein
MNRVLVELADVNPGAASADARGVLRVAGEEVLGLHGVLSS